MNPEANRLLFGHDPETRLLAVEPCAESEVELFSRSPEGALLRRREPLHPILWTAGLPPEVKVRELRTLEGDLALGFLAVCEGWSDFIALRTALKNAGLAHHAPGDPAHQYLLQSGKTLFEGLAPGELRRMQIVLGGEASAAAIERIELADNHGWSEVLEGAPERDLLAALTGAIRSRDPDVIEGHDLYRSTLRRILTRARRVRLKLPWGRDDSVPTSRSSRLQIAERTIAYPRCAIYGRHLVDTFVLAHQWDVGARELEGFTLEEVAAHFRIGGPRPAQVRALVDLLGASAFIQAGIFPYTYSDVLLRGNATRIDTLFLREYYRRGHSIATPPETRAFEGGATEVYVTGVAKNVWHCDVTSLYPSVMLRFGLFPASDRLGIFRSLLADLRTFRTGTKAALRAAATPEERDHLNALQSAFKILINSFYGYLGFGQGHFADFDAAARVTATGRELLGTMVAHLREAGAEVIEIDTDGIYFIPPAENATLPETLAAVLPSGIDVEFDARYPAMFSYKAKNYALLTEEGELILRGGALRSRGMEPFQRRFLEAMLRLLLSGQADRIASLRAEYEANIRQRLWPIAMLAKTDTLQESLAQYSRKIDGSARNRSAPYELALQSGRPYEPGDSIAYYITGEKKKVTAYTHARRVEDWNPERRDENIEYYVGKLDELIARFRAHLP